MLLINFWPHPRSSRRGASPTPRRDPDGAGAGREVCINKYRCIYINIEREREIDVYIYIYIVF